MPVREIEDIEELKSLVGEDVSTSDWVEVTQEMINKFADATLDHQWIHIDVERAKKESPFGGPIGHGYLTLSLFPHMMATAYTVKQKFKLGVNYGLNKLRFMSPVPAGSRVRAHIKLLKVMDVKNDGFQIEWQVTVEIEGHDKPACVAQAVYRSYT